MRKIVECVPNFSEGRDKRKIDLIVEAARQVKGIKILDVDSNPDYNRTVLTFVGSPQAVKKAAFAAIKKSLELIDMRKHRGEHPRIGGCDVCPFVPVQGVTMDNCVELARELARKVGEELKIPVYLYGEAAQKPERRNLAIVRQSEYEGLAEKLREKEWKPDFGPAKFVSQSGACIIGAREFLVAYNVNLKTKDKRVAQKIAGIIRESGFILISKSGEKIRIPGLMKEVKAFGVYLPERGICQVSMNLTNYKITPPHIVFETIKRLAEGLVEVSGSEIVGLVPKEAILSTGRFYLGRKAFEEKLIGAAIENLGLNSLKRFDPKKKIIEYLT